MSLATSFYSVGNTQADQGPVTLSIPTVFVGLGGSGKSVLMLLRKQFHERYASRGSVFQRFARFVFIDTDKSGFVPKDEKDAMFADVIPGEDEIVESTIKGSAFQSIFDKIDLQVESDHLHWLKPSMRQIGPGAVEDGAGTHRQFGRLAFFENYEAIRQRIKTQIEEVLHYAGRHANEVASDRIEVVIVTSLAGGTGSGMFLDVAYLVRNLLSGTDYNALRIKHVTLVAFLPEVFSSTPAATTLMPRFRQNAYAALLELEYYGTKMTGDALYLGEEPEAGRDGRHGFRVNWTGKPQDERFFADRGWDTLFLVDNVNNLTQASRLPANAVFQMTADYLFLDFGNSRFAIEKRSARSNLVQYKDRWKATWVRRLPDPSLPKVRDRKPENVFATQNGCIYSSFGLAEIFFDVDNLYQAAGYRLASQLVRQRWIGSTNGDYTPENYQEWADQDLLFPPRPSHQAEPPISFHPDKIAERAVVLDDKDWLAVLRDDLSELDKLEDEEAAADFPSLLEKHRELLATTGKARRTIAQNVSTWKGTEIILGPWRRRLQILADERLSKHGAEATKQLLAEYRKLLIELRDEVAEADPGSLAPSLLSRLEEAGAVPFPVRAIALRIELGKARAEAETALRRFYDGTAKRDSEPAVISSINYVGEVGKKPSDGVAKDAHGTLQEWIAQVSQHLRNLGDRLGHRFEVAAKGRDQVDHRKQSLTVVWDEDLYDRKLNEALLLFEKVGRDLAKTAGSDGAKFAFEFDWVKLERLVLDKLRGPDTPDLPNDSLAALVRFQIAHKMTNEEHVKKFAQQLADACTSVIRDAKLKLADVEHGNVADLLCNAKTTQQRDQMIEQLVIAAAPYLPTTNRNNNAEQAAHHNLFGLSVGQAITSPANVGRIADMVATTAAARESTRVAGFGQRLEAEQSAALFVRMMAGFPLQDYTRLGELYDAYKQTPTSTQSNDECHIDYKQSWEDLPDIRAVGDETYSLIRDKINLVLLNMMIGVIMYPKDRDAFYVLIPDPYGPGEDFARLGKRISRAIKHACDDTTIRDYLAERWEQWSEKATVKGWACLYESALRTRNESRREITVASGQSESAPFRNCFGGLIQMIGKKLSEFSGGGPWLAALKPATSGDLIGHDEDVKPGPRPVGLDAALRKIHGNINIYQLIPSKVEQVTLPESEPDVVSPSA